MLPLSFRAGVVRGVVTGLREVYLPAEQFPLLLACFIKCIALRISSAQVLLSFVKFLKIWMWFFITFCYLQCSIKVWAATYMKGQPPELSVQGWQRLTLSAGLRKKSLFWEKYSRTVLVLLFFVLSFKLRNSHRRSPACKFLSRFPLKRIIPAIWSGRDAAELLWCCLWIR